ncbi:MAG: ROK family protein [Candidatus Latescibacterota bacterium]|nr:ROK family protein [Candidatus Latescibacterota bacterium]
MGRYGAVEAGGTKFICAVGGSPDTIDSELTIDTASSELTLSRVVEFFVDHHRQQPLDAIGVGCFGPVDLSPDSPTYGHITTTPKPGWGHVDILGPLRMLDLPLGFDTDVNAAALGEQRWGAAQGLQNLVYLTVGTGIGGGAVVEGNLLHGLVHPEMGHVPVPHDLATDPFAGACPFHGDCLEGLASGPAIQQRWGRPAPSLESHHPAWDLEARYLACALANFIFTLSPQRLILGGGIMEQSHLFPKVRQQLTEQLRGYIQSPAILEDIDHYVVPPGLGSRPGICGGLVLAEQAVRIG